MMFRMKRYAASYIYLSAEQVFTTSVIEVESGIVRNLFSLSQEIHSTVWLPGIIILSVRKNISIENISTFGQLIKQLTYPGLLKREEWKISSPFYAYHIFPINLLTKEFLPGWKIQLLS